MTFGTCDFKEPFNFSQIFFVGIDADWGSPTDGQYHIQTDEGPERYFRYLTDSGQFRKEKRLKDGTVIGTKCRIVNFTHETEFNFDFQVRTHGSMRWVICAPLITLPTKVAIGY